MADLARVWLNKAAAARHLGVSRSTLDEWRRTRDLPSTTVGRVVRFDRELLDEWFTDYDGSKT